MTNNRWLITIDLDGTLLSNDSIDTDDAHLISEKNIDEIQKCISNGHKVAIVTGRPWRNTRKIYEKMKLHTIVANYNGSHIHHPFDKGFSEIKTAMNRKFFIKMLTETSLKDALQNFIIEFDEETYMYDLTDKIMKKQFHINEFSLRVKKCDIDFLPEKNPHAIIFKIEYNYNNKYSLITELKRKFGEALSFRYWDNLKEQTLYLEVNQKFISKAYAMMYIASYYNIPLSRTIAFGDGENDIEMLSNAERGVAMKNASNVVKSYAKDVTDFYNYEDGVGKYLENFFKNLEN